jgi:hypothetical protein
MDILGSPPTGGTFSQLQQQQQQQQQQQGSPGVQQQQQVLSNSDRRCSSADGGGEDQQMPLVSPKAPKPANALGFPQGTAAGEQVPCVGQVGCPIAATVVTAEASVAGLLLGAGSSGSKFPTRQEQQQLQQQLQQQQGGCQSFEFAASQPPAAAGAAASSAVSPFGAAAASAVPLNPAPVQQHSGLPGWTTQQQLSPPPPQSQHQRVAASKVLGKPHSFKEANATGAASAAAAAAAAATTAAAAAADDDDKASDIASSTGPPTPSCWPSPFAPAHSLHWKLLQHRKQQQQQQQWRLTGLSESSYAGSAVLDVAYRVAAEGEQPPPPAAAALTTVGAEEDASKPQQQQQQPLPDPFGSLRVRLLQALSAGVLPAASAALPQDLAAAAGIPTGKQGSPAAAAAAVAAAVGDVSAADVLVRAGGGERAASCAAAACALPPADDVIDVLHMIPVRPVSSGANGCVWPPINQSISHSWFDGTPWEFDLSNRWLRYRTGDMNDDSTLPSNTLPCGPPSTDLERSIS